MATLIPTGSAVAQPANPPGTTPYTISQAASDLLGADQTGVANSLYAAPGVSPQNANMAVGNLFSADIAGNQLTSAANATAAQDTAQGQAQGITAQGDQAEANQYLQAGSVADTNARLARASAGLQVAQEDRNIYKAVGGQQADIAGAGFGSGAGQSGTTSMFLMADSVHQGALAKQLTTVQGNITAGGFEQQSLAAGAEAAAANAAAGAASTLGTEATNAAGTVVSNASQTASDLQTNALNAATSLLNQVPLDANGNPIAGAVGGTAGTTLSQRAGVGGTVTAGPAAGMGGTNPWLNGITGPQVSVIGPDLSGTDPNSAATIHTLTGAPLQPVNTKVLSKVDTTGTSSGPLTGPGLTS